MSCRQLGAWLFVAAIHILMLSSTHAQDWPMADPYPTLYEGPPPEADLATVAYGSPGIFKGPFFQYDALYWTISAPRTVAVGDPDAEHYLIANGMLMPVENSLSTNWVDDEWNWAHRIEFGYAGESYGWLGGVLFGDHEQRLVTSGVTLAFNDPDGLLQGYTDSNEDGIDDDHDGDAIHGRHGLDLGTPNPAYPDTSSIPFLDTLDGIPDRPALIDTGDLMEFVVTFGAMDIKYSTEFTGVDLMGFYRLPGSRPGNMLDLYLGARYLGVRDYLYFNGTGGVLDTSRWNTAADNDIIGPQIGARWWRRQGPLTLVAEGRFLAGLNFQSVQQRGEIGTNAEFGGTNAPVNLTANSFVHAYDDREFSPVGEWRLEFTYHFSRYAALRAGYTGMVMGGINRAAPQIEYTLPSFGLSRSDSQETVVATAFTLGIEIGR
jgi:hypothetical protein